MTDLVERSWVRQYDDVLRHQFQQMGARMLGAVDQEKVVGRSLELDVLGKVEAREKTTRHSTSTAADIEHTRRRVEMRDFYDRIDLAKTDEVRMIIQNPQGRYAQATLASLMRQADRLVINAMTASTTEVDEDGATSSVALPAGQIVDEDFNTANSNLIVEKVIEAHRILVGNEANMSRAYLALNASALHSLLNETNATSSDFVSGRPLESGSIGKFMGFNIIVTELLNGAGSESDPKLCLAFTSESVVFGKAMDISTRVEELPEKHFDKMIYTSMTGNALRLHDEGVVAIQCVQ